jgi:prepilin-type N-terminal cleavage/methylation domain-containing protein
MRVMRKGEAGFTLIEVIVVTAIVAIAAGTLGTFFLAGASPAVASAGRDVTAAFDEARRAAIADDAATVVFAPAAAGTGYSARIFRRFPGDPSFAPRNGPAYESTVTIAETSAPLGAPGFAFAVDSSGTVTGFERFAAGATAFTSRPCPAGGAFTLQLAYERDVRVISIPCELPQNAATPPAFETPQPATRATPYAAQTCPATQTCTLAIITPPPAAATCPPGYTSDANLAGVCDLAPPSPAPSSVTTPASPATCPPGETGTPPACVLAPPPGSPPAACTPGAADAAGFASCLESAPLRITGPAITHAGCGTHVPIADPGGAFTVAVDVFQNGSFWGGYDVRIGTQKIAWLDFGHLPPSADCGLAFSLRFSVQTITAVSGNAQSTPSVDTGDPGLADQGVGSIVVPPAGAIWGSNS